MAIERANFKLVTGSCPNARQKEFPDTAFTAKTHGVTTAIPGVEVADDADALGIRSPDSKCGSLYTVDFAQMCAEAFIGAQVLTFSQQPDVKLAENRGKPVRVIDLLDVVRPGNPQTIVEWNAPTENGRLEKPGGIPQSINLALSEFDQHLSAIGIDHGNRFSPGLQAAQPETTLGTGVQSEDGKRVAVFATA